MKNFISMILAAAISVAVVNPAIAQATSTYSENLPCASDSKNNKEYQKIIKERSKEVHIIHSNKKYITRVIVFDDDTAMIEHIFPDGKQCLVHGGEWVKDIKNDVSFTF